MLESTWFQEVSRRCRWLVGVSGGADSVALLHGLKEQGFRNLVVCHLNHGLRGKASAADARFVGRLADGLGFSAEISRANVKRRMRESRESMETAARRERHRFFADCARKYRCKRLLLAHHADDQAETVLWNLLRGSHGLKGMKEVREMVAGDGVTLEIHRPLLKVRRGELVDWLCERGIRWREDATNAEPVAVRNRLRNEAIPLLDEITGRDVVGSVSRLAEDWEAAGEIVEWALETAVVRDPQGRLHVPVLRKLPPALQQAALRKLLEDHAVVGMDRALLRKAVDLLEPSAGFSSVNLPGGKRLRRREGRVYVEEAR